MQNCNPSFSQSFEMLLLGLALRLGSNLTTSWTLLSVWTFFPATGSLHPQNAAATPPLGLSPRSTSAVPRGARLPTCCGQRGRHLLVARQRIRWLCGWERASRPHRCHHPCALPAGACGLQEGIKRLRVKSSALRGSIVCSSSPAWEPALLADGP